MKSLRIFDYGQPCGGPASNQVEMVPESQRIFDNGSPRIGTMKRELMKMALRRLRILNESLRIFDRLGIMTMVSESLRIPDCCQAPESLGGKAVESL